MKKIIVSKHFGVIEYIIRMGIADRDTPVFPSVSHHAVKGCHVIGIVPFSIAASCALYTEVKVGLPPQEYNKELTFDEVRARIKEVRTYRVELVEDHLF